MKVYAWLIDLTRFRENCPTGIIPEWMQKVTQHNGIVQYIRLTPNVDWSFPPDKFVAGKERIVDAAALVRSTDQPAKEWSVNGNAQWAYVVSDCHRAWSRATFETWNNSLPPPPLPLAVKSDFRPIACVTFIVIYNSALIKFGQEELARTALDRNGIVPRRFFPDGRVHQERSCHCIIPTTFRDIFSPEDNHVFV